MDRLRIVAAVVDESSVELSTMTTMTEIKPALRRKIDKAATDLAVARKEWRKATEYAAKIAVEASEAGMSEVELARDLGVDRARTLRRWLGKPAT